MFFKKNIFINNVVDYPVIFLHGLAGGLKDWEKTINKVSDSAYFDVRYFDREKIYHNYFGQKVKNWYWNASYYTTKFMDDSIYGNLSIFADRLKNIINTVCAISKKDKAILIAHSMGGLISRKYMTINRDNWNRVHKLLTVATPNLGFGISLGIIQQLRDLKRNSKFIKKLDEKWEVMMRSEKEKKWGVIGGINVKAGHNIYDDPKSTDSGGIGFVEISSSIPYDEWMESIGDNMEEPFYNTKHFGFRAATSANHNEILYSDVTLKGIEWASRK